MIRIEGVAEVGPIAARRRLFEKYKHKPGRLGAGPFSWFMQCNQHKQDFKPSCLSCIMTDRHNEQIWQELEMMDRGL